MIDDDVLDFISGTIRSTWAVELLLFLREQRGRAWTVDDLVREQRSSLTIVTEGLGAFEAAGLVRREDGDVYRYEPAATELDRLVARLAVLYRERRMTVVKAILGAPNDKLRTFADAFKLTRD